MDRKISIHGTKIYTIMNNQPVSLALQAQWQMTLQTANRYFGELSDEQLAGAIIEGRSTGYFLLGHLLVTLDDLVEAVFDQPRQLPEWRPLFQSSMSDLPGYPEVAALRQQWASMTALITEKLAQITDQELLGRHNWVSAEDFEKDPSRSKLTFVSRRILHQQYHVGQVALLVAKFKYGAVEA